MAKLYLSASASCMIPVHSECMCDFYELESSWRRNFLFLLIIAIVNHAFVLFTNFTISFADVMDDSLSDTIEPLHTLSGQSQ